MQLIKKHYWANNFINQKKWASYKRTAITGAIAIAGAYTFYKALKSRPWQKFVFRMLTGD